MLRIMHCADLHLDSPFAGLPPEQAAQRRQLQRCLPGQIVDRSNELGCQLLLVAGDVFDGDRVSPETIEALRTAFARSRARVFIAAGNHDPLSADSPWTAIRWPEQVHIFGSRQEAVLLPELGCRVWGRSFTGRESYAPLEPVSAEGWLEIGVFHGDPENPGPYGYLPPDQIAASGLDYLALGHIHRRSMPRQAGKTWYGWPGVAMGRGFDETGICGVFHVTLDQGGCKACVEPLPGPRYEKLTVSVGEEPDVPADGRQLHCRITLIGESDPPDLDALWQRWNGWFHSLELRDETIPKRELWADCGDGTLRGLALDWLKAHGEQEDPQLAAMAARYLLAALEGRELPCEF